MIPQKKKKTFTTGKKRTNIRGYKVDTQKSFVLLCTNNDQFGKENSQTMPVS